MSHAKAIADNVGNMVRAVNAGDMTAVVGSFVEAPIIVEDVPPYLWQGPTAVRDWLAAMARNAETLGVTSISMELGSEIRIESRESRGYAVFPGQLTLTAQDGSLIAEGQLTVTLVARSTRWLIDSLVWTGPQPIDLSVRNGWKADIRSSEVPLS